MNRDTKLIELPALTADLLNANGILLDNVFASLWREIGMNTILRKAGFRKRSGTPIGEVIFSLMLWLWLKKDSIGMFARESLQGAMGKDVLYDTMNREDLNWRKYHQQITIKTTEETWTSSVRVEKNISILNFLIFHTPPFVAKWSYVLWRHLDFRQLNEGQ